jgi:hypothetical protein
MEPYSEEVKILSQLREWNDEPIDVTLMRECFANIFQKLTSIRDSAWRGEKGKAANIAITQLRIARSIAIESIYLK